MSNRIQPTHFVEVFRDNQGVKLQDDCPIDLLKSTPYCKHSGHILFMSYVKPIALFLIRLKTPQEQANSIYYPLNKQV